MSLFLPFISFCGHLILITLAQKEQPTPRGQLRRGALGESKSHSRSNSSSPAFSSTSLSAAAAAAAAQGFKDSSPESRSSFHWSPLGRRTGSLYCRVGIGFHLQIHPDGKVNGSHEANKLTILEIFALSHGIVGIRGVYSNTFLAMSRKGKLHASNVFTDDCKFRERFQENSYNTYASATYRTKKTDREWYVALNKRGKAKRGCSPRVKPQHISTHFLPRINQSDPPELSFTVTVPKKDKSSSGSSKPKVPLLVPKKISKPVKYRLKFRFG